MGAFHRDALHLSAFCLMRQDAVDLEADNFDDIDDEKLMAQLQQGLMKAVHS
ncbi:unnamed protein product [Symbiodinium sp. CCMP2592]|nr:unnamed protein product [Symbiodinium sp. CCMP2592]